MTNEQRAAAIMAEVLKWDNADISTTELRAFILQKLQDAYKAGDTHGMNNPHPGESMGR